MTSPQVNPCRESVIGIMKTCLLGLMALSILSCTVDAYDAPQETMDTGSADVAISNTSLGDTGADIGTTDIWAARCAAAVIEETCTVSSCHRHAIIPADIYCRDSECPRDLADYEARFSTCDSPHKEWRICAWEREVGCGVVQFTQPSDESWFYAIAFAEADGSFLGFTLSSDSSIGRCEADDYRVGTFNDYLHRYDSACNVTQRTICCHRQPPHLW